MSRHRGRDAGRAPGALPHAAHAPGALLRRLPRLVGRRAARPRQPAAAAPHLHAARDGRAHAAGAAHSAATSPACWSTRCRRCTRTPARRATRRWSTARAARSFDRDAYTDWLQQLRQVCSERGIVLIFDEVFVGFRLAPGGAQEYFGVRADMVTYGKTLGGGLPVGVVCGRRELMKRFREDRPADICFARGTFNSHPYVMGAMQVFLERLRASPRCARCTTASTSAGTGAPQTLNHRLREAGLPVRVANLSTHLDRVLHPALALQLDAAVLPARAGPGAQLGRHRAPDLQPELRRRRLRRGAAALRRRRARDAGRRLVVERAGR